MTVMSGTMKGPPPNPNMDDAMAMMNEPMTPIPIFAFMSCPQKWMFMSYSPLGWFYFALALFGLFFEVLQYLLLLLVLGDLCGQRLPEHKSGEDDQDDSKEALELGERDQLGEHRADEPAGEHGDAHDDAQLPVDELDLAVVVDARALGKEHRREHRSRDDSMGKAVDPEQKRFKGWGKALTFFNLYRDRNSLEEAEYEFPRVLTRG